MYHAPRVLLRRTTIYGSSHESRASSRALLFLPETCWPSIEASLPGCYCKVCSKLLGAYAEQGASKIITTSAWLDGNGAKPLPEDPSVLFQALSKNTRGQLRFPPQSPEPTSHVPSFPQATNQRRIAKPAISISQRLLWIRKVPWRKSIYWLP